MEILVLTVKIKILMKLKKNKEERIIKIILIRKIIMLEKYILDKNVIILNMDMDSMCNIVY